MSQHHTQGRQGQGSRRNYHKNYQRRGERNRVPRPDRSAPKLTFWQKLLKAIGLYKPAGPRRNERNKNAVVRVSQPGKQQGGRRPSFSKAPTKSPRLYIGNLSYEVSEMDIEELFKGFGRVKSVEIIYNPRTHKSKGYGFVEMFEMADATRCVDVLHGQPFMGREMMVSAANDRQEKGDAAEVTAARLEEKSEPIVAPAPASAPGHDPEDN